MNFFDLVFLLVILAGVASGLAKGAFREFLAAGGVALGYFAAIRLANGLVYLPMRYVSDPHLAKLAAILGLYLGGWFLGYLLAFLVRHFVDSGLRSISSRALGSLFGLAKGGIVCLLIAWLVSSYVPSYLDDLQTSGFYPLILKFGNLFNGANLA